MSLPAALCERTLSTLTESLGLAVTTDLDLTSPMSPTPVGRLRVLHGGPIDKAVVVSLVVPKIGLDSHMVFAFTPADSPIPHFTLDSVASAEYYAMHLDLIPRADLAVHLDYLDDAFAPLTDLFEGAWTLDGLSAAAIGPRQRAMMSPWMVVCRATPDAFRALDDTVDGYLRHWLTLVDKGIDAIEGELSVRDAAARANLFDPRVDPVWERVRQLIGDEQCERVRGELLA
ncbi:hypothetical protein ACTD5D_16790 [Nocardia takedensis]|uniref:hypothetical protein n=1 Tax=Nocardia takedensis TaxID=259390 RepID=UPI0002D57A99|nr:hypothetical protein [Nocardia takedensis]